MAQIFRVLALFAVATLTAGANEEAARAELRPGFVLYQDAAAADQRLDYAAALAGYKKALPIYQALQAKYPEWASTNGVSLRLSKLEDRIRELENIMTPQDAARAQGDLLAITVQQEAAINNLEREKGELAAEIIRLRGAVEAAREEAARNAETSKRVDDLLWENRELKQTICRRSRVSSAWCSDSRTTGPTARRRCVHGISWRVTSFPRSTVRRRGSVNHRSTSTPISRN
jgi:hypothetical protein